MTELCCVRRVSQIYQGQFGETRSISIFVKKKILVSKMFIIAHDVCEYDLVNILKVIIAKYTSTEVRI